MNAIGQVDSLPKTAPGLAKYFTRENAKKALLIALSAIMVVGMIVTYILPISWLWTLLFFALALAPLYPLGKKVDDQRDRIIS